MSQQDQEPQTSWGKEIAAALSKVSAPTKPLTLSQEPREGQGPTTTWGRDIAEALGSGLSGERVGEEFSRIYDTAPPEGSLHPLVSQAASGATLGIVPPERISLAPKTGQLLRMSPADMEEMVRERPEFEPIASAIKSFAQQTQQAAEQTYGPQAGDPAVYEQAAAALRQEVGTEIPNPPITMTMPEDFGEQGERFRAAVAERSIPGVHEPPWTEERVAEVFQEWLEEAEAGRIEAFRHRHPYLSIIAQAVPEGASFVAGMGAASLPLRAAGLTGAGLAAGSAGLADVGAQAARIATGAQERFDPAAAITQVAGGAVAPVASRIAGRAVSAGAGRLAASGWQRAAQILRRAQGPISGAAGVGSMEAVAEGIRPTGEPLGERLARIGAMAAGGAALHRALPGRGAARRAPEVVQKVLEKAGKPDPKPEAAPEDAGQPLPEGLKPGEEYTFHGRKGKLISTEASQAGRIHLQTEAGELITAPAKGLVKATTTEPPPVQGKAAPLEQPSAERPAPPEEKPSVQRPPEVDKLRETLGIDTSTKAKVLDQKLSAALTDLAKVSEPQTKGVYEEALGRLKKAKQALSRARSAKTKDEALKALTEVRREVFDVLGGAQEQLTYLKSRRAKEGGFALTPPGAEALRKLIRKAKDIVKATWRMWRAVANTRTTLAREALYRSEKLVDHELYQRIKSGEAKVLSMRRVSPETMEFKLRDQGQEVTRRFDYPSMKRRMRKLRDFLKQETPTPKSRDEARTLAAEVASEWMSRKIGEDVIAGSILGVAKKLDRKMNIHPGVEPGLTTFLTDAVKAITGWPKNKVLGDIDDSVRKSFFEAADEARLLSYRLEQLWKDMDPEMRRHLSEAMWEAVDKRATVLPEEFPKQYQEAMGIVEKIRARYAWLGNVFADAGLLSEEAMTRAAEKGYSRRMMDGKTVWNALSARAGFIREQAGMKTILEPLDTMHFLKGRTLSDTEWYRYGGRTDIQSSLEGLFEQIKAGRRVKLLHEISRQPSLFQKEGSELVTDEQGRRERIVEVEKEIRKLRDKMAKERIPKIELAEEVDRLTRGRTAREYDRQFAKMFEEGIPFDENPYEKGTPEWKETRRAQRRLAFLTKKVAKFTTTATPEKGVAVEMKSRTHPATVAANFTLRRLEQRLLALDMMRTNWEKVPDEKRWGSLRGGYVNADVVRELRVMYPETSSLMQAFLSVMAIPKGNLTALRFATGTINLIGNLMKLMSSGIQLSSPKSWKLAVIAVRAVVRWMKRGGSIADHVPPEYREVVREFEQSGYLESSQPFMDLIRERLKSETMLRQVAQANAEKRPFDAAMLSIKAAANAYQDVLEKLPFSQRQMRFYRMTDPAMALWSWIAHRTGEGTLQPPASRELASAKHNAFFNYDNVPNLLKRPGFRAAFSFPRWAWRSYTGLLMDMVTAPTSLIPIIPAGKLDRILSIGPTTGKAKTRGGKIAMQAASTAATVGVRYGKLMATLGALHAAMRMIYGLDEEEYGEMLLEASYGKEEREKWLLPLPGASKPVFVSLRGIHPLSWFSVIPNFLKRDHIGPPLQSWEQKLLKGIIDQNVLLAPVGDFYEGKDDLGRDPKLWNALRRFLPGTLSDAVTEASKRLGLEMTGGTNKSLTQQILGLLGVQAVVPQGGAALASAEETRRLEEGKTRMVEVEVPTADPYTTERKRTNLEIRRSDLRRDLERLRKQGFLKEKD